ncbi:hypothetical protein GCM10027290_31590 [Micromonospora sonneratiae]|uniref:Phosphopantetheine-binding protein n=1 Tax=Micromonospora sonneratiae TaxID=1184706 RepID=A0ABW3YSD1_9ACTN
MTGEQLTDRLSGMFAAVLEQPEVGLDDDFFALGGHSLTAGRLVSQVKRDLLVRVTLVEFFDDPTVRGLSRLVEQRLGADSPS